MPYNQKPRIYAVATTHLDTSWSWDLETTLREYLPKTLTENFTLFEKYPDYVFSFEGAYRYELTEEYFPALFEKLKEYIKKGRWHVSGSAYENGDVNIPSPEALIRNILYGTRYFREAFGKRSEDIFLPDCFGFGWALPSVAAHANLKGFTTQKLVWSSAYGVPFDLGVWEGPDGGRIFASLDAGDYNRSLKTVRRKGSVARKLRSNTRKYGLPFTFVFHGIGDRGGAPREASVNAVLREAALNGASKTEVIFSSSDRVFRDMDSLLTPEQKKRLPVWKNELVMTNHGVGCYTSRAAGKRLNRRCEMLADAAERASVFASAVCRRDYPEEVLDTAWKRVIAHQFHDDITGTSLEICYKRNWNDYVLSLNQFAEEYRSAAADISRAADTSFVQGLPVLIFNPVQAAGKRKAAVKMSIEMPGHHDYARVFDCRGRELPSQITGKQGRVFTVVFIAEAPSVGFAVCDVRPSGEPCAVGTGVSVTERTLENKRYQVSLDENGDIAGIFDKAIGRQLLAKPVRMALHDYDGCSTYPAWESDYKEVMAQPREYAANPEYRILENGPARAAVETVRRAGGSVFKQIVSLSACGETVDVYNEVEWRSYRTLLKTEFPFTASNPKASYDLGLGVIERGNNRRKLYEVPAQLWADITDESGDFGVSVLSDSKIGWDKPAGNILRLTGIHTPRAAYRDNQHLLDFGLNRWSFAIFGHRGSWRNGTQLEALNFCQAMAAFSISPAKGPLGAEYSFCSVSEEAVAVRAMKKACDSREVILRVNETAGVRHENCRVTVGEGVFEAREVFATEEAKGPARVIDGQLVFDIGPYEPKTFALTLKEPAAKATAARSVPVSLPYNIRAAGANGTREQGPLPGGFALPAELFPAEFVSGGIRFVTAKTEGGGDALLCAGQSAPLPEGTRRLVIAAASFGSDRDVVFKAGGKDIPARLHAAGEPIGAWDLYGLGETGYIKKDPVALLFTHAHGEEGDVFGKQLCFFKYALDIPEGAAELTLPADDHIVILAATAVEDERASVCLTELYDSLDKRGFDFTVPPERNAAAKNNKRGRRKSRLKFLAGYAWRRVKREIAQL